MIRTSLMSFSLEVDYLVTLYIETLNLFDSKSKSHNETLELCTKFIQSYIDSMERRQNKLIIQS